MSTTGELYFNIVEQLRFEPNIDESNITLAVKDKGIVVLGGSVCSYTEKQLAEEAVEKVSGVQGVVNSLTVNLSSEYKRNDADIIKAALNALRWTTLVPDERIKLAVNNGHLTLSGKVAYNYQKEYAENAVRDLYGIIQVTNNIVVMPNVQPKDVKEKIISEFERHARIEAMNIKVQVNGSVVTLAGNVRNLDEAKEARRAAQSVSGITDIIDHLSVSW